MPQQGPHLDLRCRLSSCAHPGFTPTYSDQATCVLTLGSRVQAPDLHRALEGVSRDCGSLPLCRHIGFRVSGAEARRRADGDLVRLLRARKLLLVLDLDHTLLNSCRS